MRASPNARLPRATGIIVTALRSPRLGLKSLLGRIRYPARVEGVLYLDVISQILHVVLMGRSGSPEFGKCGYYDTQKPRISRVTADPARDGV